MKRLEVHILHVIVTVAIAAAATAVAITLAARGPTHHTAVAAIAPQQAPAVTVVQQAHVSPALKAQDTLPCPPPPGEGVLGVCTPKPVKLTVKGSSTPTVAPVKVDPPACTPDVSSWQGYNVDWGAIKRWQLSRGCTPSGIFKIGEYTTDPTAATNNAHMKALGMVRQGYWFVRRTGCATEANQIVNEAHALGLSVVWLDMEVPEASGYGNCLTPTIKAHGITVGTYASPGAFPGGSPPNAAWIAAYGPASPPSAPWGGPIKAFQCTDGVFGCVTTIPGIPNGGRGDVSVDFGATKLGVKLAPLCSRTLCLNRFGSHRLSGGRRAGLVYGKTICRKGCDERQLVGWWQGAQSSTHSHRLWLRYRLQAIDRHLEALIQRSAPIDNVKAERGLRAHVVWAIAFQAAYRHDFNDYEKVKG